MLSVKSFKNENRHFILTIGEIAIAHTIEHFCGVVSKEIREK